MENKELQEKIIKLEYIFNELIKFNIVLCKSFNYVSKDLNNFVFIYKDFNFKRITDKKIKNNSNNNTTNNDDEDLILWD